MKRQRILNALLIASFGAMAATGAAQTTPTTAAQDNTPKTAPAGDTATPPAAGTTGSSYGGTMAPSDSTVKAPATADSSAPTSMSGYKAARAACDKQPLKDQCRTALNQRYSAVSPQCQKLSGAALDDCLKGADTGQ